MIPRQGYSPGSSRHNVHVTTRRWSVLWNIGIRKRMTFMKVNNTQETLVASTVVMLTDVCSFRYSMTRRNMCTWELERIKGDSKLMCLWGIGGRHGTIRLWKLGETFHRFQSFPYSWDFSPKKMKNDNLREVYSNISYVVSKIFFKKMQIALTSSLSCRL